MTEICIPFPFDWTREDGAFVHGLCAALLQTIIGGKPTDEEISAVFQQVLVLMNKRQRAGAH
jgi:hypothetical protein